MPAHNDIELRSEKVRHIIGNIPPLLIRSGITFIATIVCALLLAAWFIPYPQTLQAPATIFFAIPQTDTTLSTTSADATDRTLSAIATDSAVLTWHATARLPYTHITQLSEGMPVQLELEGYPSRTFGYLKGHITHINKSILSQPDGQNTFTITISLSTPNTTSTSKTSSPQSPLTNIDIQPNMHAHALILLSNQSILQHILKNIL